MKYDLGPFQGRHYQPLVGDSLFWETEDPKYLVKGSERFGLDRIKVILDEINDEPGSLLDIGCNIGFMSFVAQNRGHRATGIDNDIHQQVKKTTSRSSIETARQLRAVYGLRPEFIVGDYLEEIEGRSWDRVLYLNIWHHRLIGYGHGDSDFQRLGLAGAEAALKKVWAAAGKTMYFETDGSMKPTVEAGWGQENIAANLERVLGVEPVAIHTSPDVWLNPRIIWRLDKRACHGA